MTNQKDGEIDFLYGHLVGLIDKISSSPKFTHDDSIVYIVQIDDHIIADLYHELNVFGAMLPKDNDNEKFTT